MPKFAPRDLVQIGPERFIVVGTPHHDQDGPWWPVSPIIDGSSSEGVTYVRWYAEGDIRRIKTAAAIHLPTREMRPNGLLPGLGLHAAPKHRVRIAR
jgi:hypothetical protein